MANRDYLVTVKVTFTRKYLVNAKDWEYAEDYAVDEAIGDNYSVASEDCEIEPYEVEEV